MTISLHPEKTAAFLIALMMCGIYLGISIPIGAFILGALIWIGHYLFTQFRAGTLLSVSGQLAPLKSLSRSGLFIIANCVYPEHSP